MTFYFTWYRRRKNSLHTSLHLHEFLKYERINFYIRNQYPNTNMKEFIEFSFITFSNTEIITNITSIHRPNLDE